MALAHEVNGLCLMFVVVNLRVNSFVVGRLRDGAYEQVRIRNLSLTYKPIALNL
jgi:hypothetical protein